MDWSQKSKVAGLSFNSGMHKLQNYNSPLPTNLTVGNNTSIIHKYVLFPVIFCNCEMTRPGNVCMHLCVVCVCDEIKFNIIRKMIYDSQTNVS